MINLQSSSLSRISELSEMPSGLSGFLSSEFSLKETFLNLASAVKHNGIAKENYFIPSAN